MLELKSDFLLELRADLDQPAYDLGTSVNGQRRIVYVTGGTVSGPKVNGEVLPGGGDWLTTRPDGVTVLDVRALLRTDDEALIYVWYRGYSQMPPDVLARFQAGDEIDPSEYYFRTTPVFETTSEKYEWLTRTVCVGVGALKPGGVMYKVYEIL